MTSIMISTSIEVAASHVDRLMGPGNIKTPINAMQQRSNGSEGQYSIST